MANLGYRVICSLDQDLKPWNLVPKETARGRSSGHSWPLVISQSPFASQVEEGTWSLILKVG